MMRILDYVKTRIRVIVFYKNTRLRDNVMTRIVDNVITRIREKYVYNNMRFLRDNVMTKILDNVITRIRYFMMTRLLNYVITKIGENVFTTYKITRERDDKNARLRYNKNTGKRVYKRHEITR